jgi:hypothetical protein
MSRRQKASQQRRSRFWQERAATATTPSARAGVAWDELRSLIGHLPADQRLAAWSAVTDAIATARHRITDGELRSEVRSTPANSWPLNAQARARARARGTA